MQDLPSWFTAGLTFGSAIAGVAVGVWTTARRLSRKRNKLPKPLEELSRNDLQIYEQLTRLRTILGPSCIRVYLSKFHNGDHYVDGSDILKKSRTHEVVADGISYQADQFTPVLTSTLLDEMQIIGEAGPGYRSVAKLPDGKFRWLCVRGGVVSVARAAVRRGKDIVGFIGADFNDAPEEPPDLTMMLDCAGRVGDMLGDAQRAR